MIKNFLSQVNLKLFLSTFFIFTISLVTLYSSIPSLSGLHLLYYLIGLLIFFLINLTDPNFFVKFSNYFFYFILALLLVVFFVGFTIGGASSWLKIGSYTFQPSEIAKVSLILLLTKVWISNTTWKFWKIELKNKFLKSLLVFLPLVGLVVIQPDLGTSLVMIMIFFAILIVSPFEKKYLLYFFIGISIFSSYFWNFLQDYQKERIVIFLNPEMDKFGAGYNSIQSTIAVGSGGFFGKGFQKGTQSQLNFLPIFWTDFLVAAYSEEWGFLGLVFFLIIYLIFLNEIRVICLRNRNPASKYIGIGVLIYFGFQFTINVGMNLGVLPVTGIPVPFFSYGGTSMLTSFFLLGLVNKISMEKA